MIAALIVITIMEKVIVNTGRLYQHRGIRKTTHKGGTVKKKRLIQKTSDNEQTLQNTVQDRKMKRAGKTASLGAELAHYRHSCAICCSSSTRAAVEQDCG